MNDAGGYGSSVVRKGVKRDYYNNRLDILYLLSSSTYSVSVNAQFSSSSASRPPFAPPTTDRE